MTMKTTNDNSPGAAITRRSFIGRTALATAAISMPFVNTKGQVLGANSRIGIGFIGAGGRSASHFTMVSHIRNDLKEPVEIVAVADIYRPRMEKRKSEYKVPNGYLDHRELLANKDVDLVCIATPDHHHGHQAMEAIQAGKDVYCEKPVTHWRQVGVMKQLAEVAAKSDRVFQLGTQAMSDSAWRQMKKLVKDGVIGQPLFGETGFFRTGDWGERGMPVDDPNAKPGPDLNWEAFLGDSPKVDFSVDRFFRWRLFQDYAGGPATDLFPHCLTQVVDILGVGFPSEVVGLGSVNRYPYPLRDVPDTFSLIAQYPEKVTISVIGTQGNNYETTDPRGSGQRQPVIRGWDGSLTIQQNKQIVFTPTDTATNKDRQVFPIEHGEDNVEHWRNLLDCCRRRSKETWSPIGLAFRTQTVLQMALKAWHDGKTCHFDAATQTMS